MRLSMLRPLIFTLLSASVAFGQLVVNQPNYEATLDRVALWIHPDDLNGDYVLDQLLVGPSACIPSFEVSLSLEVDINPTATYVTGEVGDPIFQPLRELGTVRLGGLDWNQGRVFSRVRSLAADAPFGHYRLRTSAPRAFQATSGCALDSRIIGAPEVVDFYTAGKRRPTADNPVIKSDFVGTETLNGALYTRLRVSLYVPWAETRLTFFQEGIPAGQVDIERPAGSNGEATVEFLLQFDRTKILQTHFKNLVTGESLVIRAYKEGARYSYE